MVPRFAGKVEAYKLIMQVEMSTQNIWNRGVRIFQGNLVAELPRADWAEAEAAMPTANVAPCLVCGGAPPNKWGTLFNVRQDVTSKAACKYNRTSTSSSYLSRS